MVIESLEGCGEVASDVIRAISILPNQRLGVTPADLTEKPVLEIDHYLWERKRNSLDELAPNESS